MIHFIAPAIENIDFVIRITVNALNDKRIVHAIAVRRKTIIHNNTIASINENINRCGIAAVTITNDITERINAEEITERRVGYGFAIGINNRHSMNTGCSIYKNNFCSTAQRVVCSNTNGNRLIN